MNQIYADTIRSYQAERHAAGRRPRTINHEIKPLLRVLRRTRVYLPDTHMLPLPRSPIRVHTQYESQTSFRRLPMAYEKRFFNMASLKVQSTCDPLGSDPLFQALLRRVNNPEYWTGTEDGRQRRDSTGSQKQ